MWLHNILENNAIQFSLMRIIFEKPLGLWIYWVNLFSDENFWQLIKFKRNFTNFTNFMSGDLLADKLVAYAESDWNHFSSWYGNFFRVRIYCCGWFFLTQQSISISWTCLWRCRMVISCCMFEQQSNENIIVNCVTENAYPRWSNKNIQYTMESVRK